MRLWSNAACNRSWTLDNSRHAKFIGSLKTSGQYQGFAKKLDAYRKPDGEVDPAQLSRDIHNNKADENLIVYKRIMDEEKKELEDIIRRVNQGRQGS
jgi:hypothetical protein